MSVARALVLASQPVFRHPLTAGMKPISMARSRLRVKWGTKFLKCGAVAQLHPNPRRVLVNLLNARHLRLLACQFANAREREMPSNFESPVSLQKQPNTRNPA
jgi:hypothetical protein